MHSAAHRALRELIAAGHLVEHRWSRLADRLPDAAAPLREGAREAEAMTDALSALGATREIAVGGAAAGLGAGVGQAMARAGEPFLERNQALRTAVLDLHHATILLHYLERVARAEQDGELAAACAEWAHRLVAIEGRVRDAAIAEGDDPERAVEPVDDSAVGRVAHTVAQGIGAAGEWVDARFSRGA
jgi:hypothetical protein